MTRSTFSLLILILLFSGCNSYKKLTYLQHIASDSLTTYQIEKEPYLLKPTDILFIRILTMNEDVNKLFNPMFATGGSAQFFRPENLYLMGYQINDFGYIELPVINEIYINGYTIEQAKDTVEYYANKLLEDPFLIVKLHTYQITVLGEVRSPGLKEYATPELNILEAIALGGDITYNGNRQQIVILRSTGEKTEVFRVDITNPNLIGKKEFYVKPNDIVYIEPLKSTLFRERTQDYLYFVTAISAILTTILLAITIANL